jgi:glycosyltransferase involved in cell wall biosynthesis
MMDQLPEDKEISIGLAPYPHHDRLHTFQGGDQVVTELLRRVLVSAGYRVEYIPFKDAVFCNQAWRSLLRVPSIYHFAVPFLYSRLINRVGHKYELIICDSKASLGVRHPRRINLFHFSYEGYRRRVGGDWSALKHAWYRFFVFVETHGSRRSINIAVSPFLEEILIRQGIHVDGVIVNAVDTDLFRPQAGRKGGDYLFVGGHHHHAKGFDLLAKLAAKGLKISCVTDHDPGGGLRHIPVRPHARMPSVYRRHRIFLFPSRFESCPMAPLEAMACGLPAVVSDVGFAPHLRLQVPEFVVPGHDGAAVARYLDSIGTVEGNYAEYAFKARQYVLEHHGYDQFRKAWLALVSAAVSDRRGKTVPADVAP